MLQNLSFIYLIIIFLACQPNASKPIINPGTQLTLIDSSFSFTEGPAVDTSGNVYFTDQPNNKIYRYNVSGELEVFKENAFRSNGLYIDTLNIIWACADAYNQLLKINPSNEVSIALNKDSIIGQFNGPNDIWIHLNGWVFFTDPMYQRPYWNKVHDTLNFQGLYRINSEGNAVLLDSTLNQPNGIVGDSKNMLLYVADIGGNKTYRYKIDQRGNLSDKKLFVERGSDGMTIDSEGNLYLTGQGVDVYNKRGEFLHHLEVSEDWTANVCFGGELFDQLFITASKSLYKIQTNVKRKL